MSGWPREEEDPQDVEIDWDSEAEEYRPDPDEVETSDRSPD